MLAGKEREMWDDSYRLSYLCTSSMLLAKLSACTLAEPRRLLEILSVMQLQGCPHSFPVLLKNRMDLSILVRQGRPALGHETDVCSRSQRFPRYLLCSHSSSFFSVVPSNRGITAGCVSLIRLLSLCPAVEAFMSLVKEAWVWQGADQKAEFSMKLWAKKPSPDLPLSPI